MSHVVIYSHYTEIWFETARRNNQRKAEKPQKIV